MKRKTSADFDKELLNLYDDYAHGRVDRRGFFERASRFAVGGFCSNGGMANTLAVRIPEIIVAAVHFYGRQPAAEDVPKIKGSLLIHNAEHDQRVNEGWPAYEAALIKAGVRCTAHMNPGANHGFHNDTTPRYDDDDAKLAWTRTIEFFNQTLRAG